MGGTAYPTAFTCVSHHGDNAGSTTEVDVGHRIERMHALRVRHIAVRRQRDPLRTVIETRALGTQTHRLHDASSDATANRHLSHILVDIVKHFFELRENFVEIGLGAPDC